ncbi:MAG: hypothetical protein ACI81P_003384, partial [Neolewinella sp.]
PLWPLTKYTIITRHHEAAQAKSIQKAREPAF